jgi:hypothetical protein
MVVHKLVLLEWRICPPAVKITVQRPERDSNMRSQWSCLPMIIRILNVVLLSCRKPGLHVTFNSRARIHFVCE